MNARWLSALCICVERENKNLGIVSNRAWLLFWGLGHNQPALKRQNRLN